MWGCRATSASWAGAICRLNSRVLPVVLVIQLDWRRRFSGRRRLARSQQLSRDMRPPDVRVGVRLRHAGAAGSGAWKGQPRDFPPDAGRPSRQKCGHKRHQHDTGSVAVPPRTGSGRKVRPARRAMATKFNSFHGVCASAGAGGRTTKANSPATVIDFAMALGSSCRCPGPSDSLVRSFPQGSGEIGLAACILAENPVANCSQNAVLTSTARSHDSLR
jgi:hypothetical protein